MLLLPLRIITIDPVSNKMTTDRNQLSWPVFSCNLRPAGPLTTFCTNIPYRFHPVAPEMVVVARQCDASRWLLLVLKKIRGKWLNTFLNLNRFSRLPHGFDLGFLNDETNWGREKASYNNRPSWVLLCEWLYTLFYSKPSPTSPYPSTAWSVPLAPQGYFGSVRYKFLLSGWGPNLEQGCWRNIEALDQAFLHTLSGQGI